MSCNIFRTFVKKEIYLKHFKPLKEWFLENCVCFVSNDKFGLNMLYVKSYEYFSASSDKGAKL